MSILISGVVQNSSDVAISIVTSITCSPYSIQIRTWLCTQSLSRASYENFQFYIDLVYMYIFILHSFYLSSQNALTVYFYVIYSHWPDITFPHEYLNRNCRNDIELFIRPLQPVLVSNAHVRCVERLNIVFFCNYWKNIFNLLIFFVCNL